jgi:hypothetical protein
LSRRFISEICALLRCYAASSGNPLLKFRDNIRPMKHRTASLDFLNLEDGTDTLSRNVGKGLPLDAVWHPRRAQISSTSRRRSETKVYLCHAESSTRKSQTIWHGITSPLQSSSFFCKCLSLGGTAN